MYQPAIDVFIGTRQRLHDTIKDLTQEQWFAQPNGFENNIAWNVGHLIVAHQGLVYRRLGVKGHIDRELVGLYRPGTSPADWPSQPNTADLLTLLIGLPQKMEEDFAAGKFDNYVKPEVKEDSIGMAPAESVMHALIGNQHHEGIHTGNISDLLSFVAK